jgi:hypothetical protein
MVIAVIQTTFQPDFIPDQLILFLQQLTVQKYSRDAGDRLRPN